MALGVVYAVMNCQGPLIPFRGGRIDSFKAGPAGVPQPQDGLSDTIQKFQRMGFTPTEMIGLVACGHSIGGVRHNDFSPTFDIPPAGNGNSGVAYFDTTFAKFDNQL
jgi:catalase (peroxidase I)